MKELTLPLEEEILQMPEVRIAAMRLGGSRVPINEGNIDVKLIPSSDRDRSMIDIMDELRRKFGNVEELKSELFSKDAGTQIPLIHHTSGKLPETRPQIYPDKSVQLWDADAYKVWHVPRDNPSANKPKSLV